jgi:hypothetical protein
MSLDLAPDFAVGVQIPSDQLLGSTYPGGIAACSDCSLAAVRSAPKTVGANAGVKVDVGYVIGGLTNCPFSRDAWLEVARILNSEVVPVDGHTRDLACVSSHVCNPTRW